MGRRRWLVVSAVLIATGLGWWVVRVTLLDPEERGNASGYGQFVLAAIGLLIIVGDWVARGFGAAEPPDLDRLTDALALAMRNQWQDAANDRSLLQPAPLPIRWRRTTERVTGPLAPAGSSRGGPAPFDPLPGLARTTAGRLRAGNRDALHRVYGGLASGRLLILGGPGTGKSSAAILLLLDALRYRDQASAEDRRHIPVPVILTLQNWDPDRTAVHDWLSRKLAELPLFSGRAGEAHATALLRAGRVAVFLDGLDEIPEHVRPVASRALSEQATFRLVLLSRVTEAVDAARQHTIAGAAAVELEPLTATDVADYLLRPLAEPAPAAWQAVTGHLTRHPHSVLARTLTTPLTASLLRDAYPPSAPVDELLDTARFADPDQITHHLLDRAITAAYTRRPGQPPPRYDSETARQTLTVVANYLNQQNTRDLNWWTIPAWVPRAPRTVMSVLLATLVFGLPFGLSAAVVDGTRLGLWTGLASGGLAVLVFGTVVGLPIGLIVGTRGKTARTPRMTRFSWRQVVAPRQLAVALPRALVFGLVFGVGFGVLTSSSSSFVAALVFGVVFGLLVRAEAELAVPPPSNRRGRPRYAIVRRLLLAVPFGLAMVPMVAFVAWLLFDYRGIIVYSDIVITRRPDYSAQVLVMLSLTGIALAFVSAVVFPSFLAVNRLVAGLPFGLVVGLVVGANSALQRDAPAAAATFVRALTYGSLATSAAALMFGTVVQFFAPTSAADPVNPVQVWRGDNAFGAALGLAAGLAAGYITWATVWELEEESVLSVVLAVVAGTGTAVWLTYSRVGAVIAVQLYLARRHRVPVRLIRFLSDARARHLMRTVGPTYQFRHAALQDHLAVRSRTS